MQRIASRILRPTSLRNVAAAVFAAAALAACGPHEAGRDAPAGATPGRTVAAVPAANVGTPVPAVPATQPAEVAPAQERHAATPVPEMPPPRIATTRPIQATPPRAATPPVYDDAPLPRPIPAPVERRAVASGTTGSIQSIVPVREQQPTSGAGAVIGGVIGGVIGNQFGHGKGRVATTGLGAVGGAVAGHEIEKRRSDGVVGYRVAIRLDDGRVQTFERAQVGNLQVGDRVRVEGGGFHRV